MPTRFDTGIDSGAISTDQRHRYRLWRLWGGAPRVNFVMLNPSTATETEDDPTIRRCIGFADFWGYGGLIVTNLFAFRATSPKDMKASSDPIGEFNDQHVREAAAECPVVVCAWGGHGTFMNRSTVVRAMLPADKLRVLRVGKNGQPWHALYTPGNTQPKRWKEIF